MHEWSPSTEDGNSSGIASISRGSYDFRKVPGGSCETKQELARRILRAMAFCQGESLSKNAHPLEICRETRHISTLAALLQHALNGFE
jgi:hypothetical protein